MEQTYYLIIIGALLSDYILSSVSALLNMKSITSDIPVDFKNHYDQEKYSQSQDYLRDKTKFGLFVIKKINDLNVECKIVSIENNNLNIFFLNIGEELISTTLISS